MKFQERFNNTPLGLEANKNCEKVSVSLRTLYANCINTAGSHYCTCRTGYNGNGIICTGIIKQYISLFLVKYEIIPSKPAPNVRKRVPDRSKVKTLLPKRCALRKFLMQVEDKSNVIKLLSMHSIRCTNRAAHA